MSWSIREIRRPVILIPAILLALTPAGAAGERSPAPRQRFPNVLLITVDTLRADRLSAYGYERPTSPHIDALLSRGARFTRARTVEPLTSPGLCSMITSLHPHEHGSTRNGLAMRPGLPSLPRALEGRGYRTAAFVGNWTLRDDLSGLGEHFEEYREVFSRKRWFGLFNSEATAEDLTQESLAWIEAHVEEHGRRPFFAWVHYVEPHAPYRLHPEQARRLGLDNSLDLPNSDRYDTEVAFVDAAIGRLLAAVEEAVDPRDTLVLFTSDHGESLGEHGYWGHGRHLYEPTLHIPMGLVWPGRVPAGGEVRAPALLIDLAPTVLGLLGLPGGEELRGFDWSAVLTGGAPPPAGRITFHQAHKGAVKSPREVSRARRNGLLEVALVESVEGEERKQILNLRNDRISLYHLGGDPGELADRAPRDATPAPRLAARLEDVRQGLAASDELGAVFDEETLEGMRALGYVD